MMWPFPKTLRISRNLRILSGGKYGASTHSSEHFFLWILQAAHADVDDICAVEEVALLIFKKKNKEICY
jgi:hypothetical protein